MSDAAMVPAYLLEFKPRFRRHAFGWRSRPAIQRIKEATTEIKKVARTEPLLVERVIWTVKRFG
jgi:hypothetical protein